MPENTERNCPYCGHELPVDQTDDEFNKVLFLALAKTRGELAAQTDIINAQMKLIRALRVNGLHKPTIGKDSRN